jgi:hypothetical protein
MAVSGDSYYVGLQISQGLRFEFPWHNFNERADVNERDGVTALDALLIINFLNRSDDTGIDAGAPLTDGWLDVSRDNQVSALDALRVINHLNAQQQSQTIPEAEPESGRFDPFLTSTANWLTLDADDAVMKPLLF